ncbi:hypothetical protein XENTR_v10015864 [Xenopus tropicalis]|nr:hypothetical protein XENTR_v10015864 [Xenopus tropicalis]
MNLTEFIHSISDLTGKFFSATSLSFGNAQLQEGNLWPFSGRSPLLGSVNYIVRPKSVQLRAHEYKCSENIHIFKYISS